MIVLGPRLPGKDAQMTLYAEDFAVGDEFTFGSHTVMKAEIIEFGEKYDSQPFHVEGKAAAESMFAGLVASVWHVGALTQRLVSEEIYLRTALRGGKRTDAVMFKAPTRPGDSPSGTVKIVGFSDHSNRPEHLDVSFAVTTRNQRQETVLTMTSLAMVARRETDT